MAQETRVSPRSESKSAGISALTGNFPGQPAVVSCAPSNVTAGRGGTALAVAASGLMIRHNAVEECHVGLFSSGDAGRKDAPSSRR
jgi:hypothetical protein